MMATWKTRLLRCSQLWTPNGRAPGSGSGNGNRTSRRVGMEPRQLEHLHVRSSVHTLGARVLRHPARHGRRGIGTHDDVQIRKHAIGVQRIDMQVRDRAAHREEMRRLVAAVPIHRAIPATHGTILGQGIPEAFVYRQIEHDRVRRNHARRHRRGCGLVTIEEPTLGDDPQRHHGEQSDLPAPAGSHMQQRRRAGGGEHRQAQHGRQPQRVPARGCSTRRAAARRASTGHT